MNEDKKRSGFGYAFIFALLLIVFGIILGVLGQKRYAENKKIDVPVIKTDITKELNKIDSLTYIVSLQEKEIENLNRQLEEKKVIVIKEVEKIKTLPADENMELLTKNLIKHGELSMENDTLPRLITLPGEDSIRVVMSENNMKDVNIISAKYESEVEINSILNSIIQADSLIIESKSDILLQNSIIMNKQEMEYQINLNSLQSTLESERKQAKMKSTSLGIATGLLAILSGALLLTR